jgi:hypothetical protein
MLRCKARLPMINGKRPPTPRPPLPQDTCRPGPRFARTARPTRIERLSARPALAQSIAVLTYNRVDLSNIILDAQQQKYFHSRDCTHKTPGVIFATQVLQHVIRRLKHGDHNGKDRRMAEGQPQAGACRIWMAFSGAGLITSYAARWWQFLAQHFRSSH